MRKGWKTPAVDTASPDEALAEWQDIASAPRDGAEIIVTDGKTVATASTDEFCDDTEWYLSAGGYSCDKNEYELRMFPGKPTHWMPLPTPPQAPEAQGPD